MLVPKTRVLPLDDPAAFRTAGHYIIILPFCYNPTMETFIIINGALVVAGVLLVLAELVLGVDSLFDLVLSGAALMLAGVIGFFAGSWLVGLVLAVALVLAYWFAGRGLVRSRLLSTNTKTNADKLLGSVAIVVRGVSGPGSKYVVKIDAEEWTAESSHKLQPGDSVEVVKVNGAILEVNKSN